MHWHFNKYEHEQEESANTISCTGTKPYCQNIPFRILRDLLHFGMFVGLDKDNKVVFLTLDYKCASHVTLMCE